MNELSMKYIVHKQPLSLDRFFIHDVAPQEANISKLEHAFILICLNRFQQIVQVHTFQADTEQLKVRGNFSLVPNSSGTSSLNSPQNSKLG